MTKTKTAKEKANELVEKFYGIIDSPCQESAKRCALICVDEIIKAVHVAQTEIEEYKQYWQEVKQEIEKL